MNLLPEEIQTKIWREYWIHEFRSKVLHEIIECCDELKKIKRFFNYDTLQNHTKGLYLFYYKKYSNYLEKLYRKKWPRLYFRNNEFPILNIIFDDEYINYHSNFINNQYVFLALFVCNYSNNYRYRIFYYFKNL